MTLPSGVEVTYSYRADGRVVSLSVDGTPILSEVDYFVFGEPSGWGYGNGHR